MKSEKEKQREFRKKNPDYYKNWKEKNPERYRAIQRRWKKKNKEYFQEYYKKNKDRLKQNRVYQGIKSPTDKTKRTKNYVVDVKLTYELILSKGKGQPTYKLHLMIYDICKNVNHKFYYMNDEIRHDIIMGSYLDAINNFDSFNEDKYYNSFPYMTEVVKRSQAKWYTKLSNKHLDIESITFTFD